MTPSQAAQEKPTSPRTVPTHLLEVVGKALYGWGDDEPNEATGYTAVYESTKLAAAIHEAGYRREAAAATPDEAYYKGWTAGYYKAKRQAAEKDGPATPSLDTRCPQTAGRCEKDSGHEGDHYTEYKEPVWSWMVGAATPSLDRDLLAEAIFESGVRQTMSQSEQAADNILAEIPIIAARLDEGSATPEPPLRYAVDGAVRSLDAGDPADALLILRAAQRDADAGMGQ